MRIKSSSEGQRRGLIEWLLCGSSGCPGEQRRQRTNFGSWRLCECWWLSQVCGKCNRPVIYYIYIYINPRSRTIVGSARLLWSWINLDANSTSFEKKNHVLSINFQKWRNLWCKQHVNLVNFYDKHELWFSLHPCGCEILLLVCKRLSFSENCT